MRVIFLDIDGVVTSARTGWFNLDIYAVHFLRWLCKAADAKIVISSTWRHNHGMNFWLPIFGEDILHPDFRTPDLRKYNSDMIRGSEIQTWLNAHPEIESYLILDDDSDMLGAQMDNFIQTDSMDGLLFEHMVKAKEHFKVLTYPKDEKHIHQHEYMFGEHTLLKKGEYSKELLQHVKDLGESNIAKLNFKP